MTKTRDSAIPRSKLTAHMPPGATTPRSGIYEQVGPRGGQTNEHVASTVGKPLPPTDGHGRGWKLVSPARQNNGK
jgi:hypothetical protein